MLYVTTREKHDAHTAPRTFLADRGGDGGLFVPYQLPYLEKDQLAALEGISFGQRIAEVLNLFFNCKLSGWDVDSAVGRLPVRAAAMSHRILIAELWQNLDGSYGRLEMLLARKIRGDENTQARVSSWLRIAIRLAVLTAFFAELARVGELDWSSRVDIAVSAGDMSAAMTVWYGREMGLPVANIICACNENCAVWDLLHHGELHTDAAVIATAAPEADVALPPELERLIYGTLGLEQNRRYVEACENGGLYVPPAELFGRLRGGIFAAVVSSVRLEVLIPSVFRTNAYLMGPYTALAYGGLMDYRAKTGESRTALILAERSPLEDVQTVARAMGTTVDALQAQLS